MNTLTPFEQGYAAFLAGSDKGDNPFDKETCPHSCKRWLQGWVAAWSSKQ
jgi:ribosome modulation factor